MPSFLSEALVLFLSSSLTLAALYFKVPIVTIQEVTGLLIAVLIIALNRLIFLNTKSLSISGLKGFLLFLCSLLVQLTVICTGGFYSLFLILFHLFALGLSLLLSCRVSFIFISFALLPLIANIFLNDKIMILFRQDPFSTILYLISFITIVPVAQLLASRYHLKDKISQALSAQVASLNKDLNVKQTILEDVNELVFVTDKNMDIISANSAVEKLTSQSSSSLTNKPMLKVILLKDADGNLADRNSFSVDQVIADKSTHIVNDFFLYPLKRSTPLRVTVKVQPITEDRKSTRLNSSHQIISYAVFCLK